MELRKIHSKKKRNYNVFFAITAAIIIVVWLITTINSFTSNSSSSESLSWAQQLSLRGTIRPNTENSRLFSHIISQDNKIFWLKSSSIDLNNFSGQVDVQGYIINEAEGTSIIEVTVITSTETTPQITKKNSLALGEKWIFIDFKDDTTYEVNLDKSDIIIKQNNEIVLTISNFLCDSKDPAKNCKKFTSPENNTVAPFASTNRNTYYKLPESKNRIVSQNNQDGFFLTPKDDTVLVNLSSYIVFLNKEYIKNNFENKITENCGKIGIKISNLEDLSYINKNWKITISTEWIKEDKSKAICEGEIKIIPELSFATQSAKNAAPISENWAEKNIESETNKPKISADSFTFESWKWFKIIFPNKKIVYQSFFAREDFWILWLKCDTKMNIADIKPKTFLDENPNYIKFNAGISIYICSNSSNNPNLTNNMTQDFIIQKDAKWRIFFIETLERKRKDFAEQIIVQ